jgi:deoxyribonuclease V
MFTVLVDSTYAPLAIVDVHYDAGDGRAACVVADRWSDPSPTEERTAVVPSVMPYRPGAFFERELPCLAAVLALVQTKIRTVVIDGYVDLDAQGTPGLGARLHAHLGGTIAVVGVAKTPFRGATFARQVIRGRSIKPLFVTALGLDTVDAARLVAQMHGAHRVPTLLARADRLARRTPSG